MGLSRWRNVDNDSADFIHFSR